MTYIRLTCYTLQLPLETYIIVVVVVVVVVIIIIINLYRRIVINILRNFIYIYFNFIVLYQHQLIIRQTNTATCY